MVEKIAETDEELLNALLRARMTSTEEQLHAGIRKATLAKQINAVLCGSALRNKGVQPMLDAVIAYLPSPLDVPPVIGTDPRRPMRRRIREVSDTEPFSALAFKIVSDPFVGRLAYFRVYSGTLSAGSYV